MFRRIPAASLRFFIFAPGLLALLSACGDSQAVVREADTGPLVADTAGLRVVEDSARAWGASATWVVSDAPVVDLGSPAQRFRGVPPVLRLSDGRIVVADGAQQTIRFFDPSGKLVTTAGARGAAAGEFQALGWIGRGAGDTVVAYDFIARRLSLFDGKGSYLRTALLKPADPQIAAEPLLTYPDGSVLFRLGRPANPFPGRAGTVLRDSAMYARFGLDGLPRESLGRFPQGESFGVRVRKEGGPAPFPVPFGLVTAVALRGDTMLIGTGASFEVASIGPSGAPVGVLRAPIPRQPVTADEASQYTANAIARLRTGSKALNTGLDSNMIRALERAPFPAQKPAFGRIMVDRTGALWVSAPLSPPAPPTSWTVFSKEGVWLGTVTTPAEVRVDEIGADYLVGLWRGPDGEERVRMYPLSRGPRS